MIRPVRIEVVPASKYPCPFCRAGFTNKRTLSSHRRRNHPGKRVGMSHAEAGALRWPKGYKPKTKRRRRPGSSSRPASPR